MALSRAEEKVLVHRLRHLLESAVENGDVPSAVCAAAVDGRALEPVAAGDSVRYGNDGGLLAPPARAAAAAETVYDLASVTKIFTALTCLVLVQEAVLDLDAPVAATLAAYRGHPGREAVTLRHLLSHTSGLPPTWSGWNGRPFPQDPPDARSPQRRELLDDLLNTGLLHRPGRTFAYSCVGYNTAMALAETAAGTPWPDLLISRVLDPLAIPDLTFTPDPDRCAATEFCPELGRGTVRGQVHDESAFVLGGAAGNAGLFGTASALLAFGERLRAGFPELLTAAAAQEMWTNQLPALMSPAAAGAAQEASGYGQGLGLRVGQTGWMGRPAAQARGHNGFTGTSLLTDRDRRVTVALLTNRVHPTRTSSDISRLRPLVHEAVYAALPRLPEGPDF